MNAEMILGLAAGLGLFLYGMKLMSDGLEKAAGSKMKSILEMCTKNRFIGVVVGTLFTAVIQSSSATTVMLVSFVNAGLMSLVQAVGPIMGANIGTTITGQLVALKLDAIAPIFIIVGIIMIMFIKKQVIQRIGEIVLGFGVLFFGMGYMTEAMKELQHAPEIVEFIQSVKNPIVLLLAGFVITTILQSSSTTIGILIGMAGASLLGTDLEVILYLTLGINMGTCTSAILAALPGKKDAKRTAMLHFLFNLAGAIVLFPVFLAFGEQIADWIYGFSRGTVPEDKMSSAIANVNTLIKIVQVLIFFPFANWIVKLAQLIIRGEDKHEEGYELKYISLATVTPASGIAVTNEIKRMGRLASENLQDSFDALINLKEDKIQKVLKQEGEIDYLCSEITNYLVRMNQVAIPISTENHIDGYFHVVSDLERIGDHAENLAEFAQRRITESIDFTEMGTQELVDMFEKVIRTVDYAVDTFTEQNETHLNEIVQLENEVDRLEKKLHNSYVKRISENKSSPKASIYTEIVSNLERVSDHATNIAFAIYDEAQYDLE